MQNFIIFYTQLPEPSPGEQFSVIEKLIEKTWVLCWSFCIKTFLLRNTRYQQSPRCMWSSLNSYGLRLLYFYPNKFLFVSLFSTLHSPWVEYSRKILSNFYIYSLWRFLEGNGRPEGRVTFPLCSLVENWTAFPFNLPLCLEVHFPTKIFCLPFQTEIELVRTCFVWSLEYK